MQTVALWGPSSSGKTAFLAQLYHQHSTDWGIYPTADSLRFLELVSPFIQANRFPPATVAPASDENVDRVAYRFRENKSGREVALVVEDRPGQESEELRDEAKKRFNEALGLILLFDPESEARALKNKIEWTLTRLNVAAGRGTTRDERPVAICLSKSDRLIQTPNDLQRATEKPREFVLEKITGEILLWLDRFCSNYELFPISSVGVRLRHGVVEPVVFYDESLMLRMGSDGSPINLLRPFAWLFDRIKPFAR